jgi:RimJ/RimL family protein N-acetyltransferase
MLELDPAEVGDRFRHLFDDNWPNSTRIFSTLEGHTLGRLASDDQDHPTWALLHETGSRSTFIGGDPRPSDVSAIVEAFRDDGNVNFLLWPGDVRQQVLPENPNSVGVGNHFWDIPTGSEEITALINATPEGCDVVPMDRLLAERCEARELTMVGTFGSVDRYLRKSFGFCLVQGEEILSEAFAVYRSQGWVEIGTITAEAHRNRGYSSITCAHLVRACENIGLRTFWYTSSLNDPSRAVARKLGYRHMRTSEYRSYFKEITA